MSKFRCLVCGRFMKKPWTSHDYCPEHSVEFPRCENHLPMFGSNVCRPNAPHRCKRAIAEGECPKMTKNRRAREGSAPLTCFTRCDECKLQDTKDCPFEVQGDFKLSGCEAGVRK